MDEAERRTCIAFAGTRRLAAGDLSSVALRAKEALDGGETGPIVLFDDVSSQVIEVDFRGTADDVRRRIPGAAGSDPPDAGTAPRRRGRPRLGVVGREVTLLPRHWEWLSRQPGGASVALRKLVEDARRTGAERDRVRQAREAAYRFMSAMAGNEPGFEEATRALFAGAADRFRAQTEAWPADVRDHARMLAQRTF